MSLLPLKALVKKDLQVHFTDRRAVILSFVLPAALSLLFGFVFRGGGGGPRELHVPILVVDQDGSGESARLVKALADDPSLTAQPASLEDARAAVRKGSIDVALVIPARWAAQTHAALDGASERASVGFLYDPSRAMELAIVKGMVVRRALAAISQAPPSEPPFLTTDEAVTGGGVKYNGASHALAGMGVQFTMMGSIFAAVAMLTDRQKGLWKRLMAAPLSRRTLLVSRTLSGTLTSLMVIAFLYVFGALTMHIRVDGDPLGFGLVIVAFAAMTAALGLVISTLGKTPEATRSVGMFIVLIAVMLGGAWFPAFLFPGWLQKVTYLVPTRWAMDGLDAMTWRGLGLEAALKPAAALFGATALFLVVAALRFRWEE